MAAGALWWDPDRHTYLSPRVAIDPRTGTASEGLLYYTEVDAWGSVFSVKIRGQDWTDQDRDLLFFALLSAFPETGGARVGAGTSGHWGEMTWRLMDVQSIALEELRRWLAEPVCHYSNAFRSHGADLAKLPSDAQASWTPRDEAAVKPSVVVKFAGRFLVNDPSRTRRRDEARGVDGIGQAMLRRPDGEAYLPASSVRGALRGQARRIWQTAAWHRGRDLNLARKEEMEARRASDVERMNPFQKIFGASGWASPVEIEDFRLTNAAPEETQEFVAIDRFTGGVAGNRKLAARGLVAPVFAGNITIQMKRWQACGIGDAGWLLLVFLLRDWIEGDLTFGFGASKGYGACTARSTYEAVGRRRSFWGICSRNEDSALQQEEPQQWEKDWLRWMAEEAA